MLVEEARGGGGEGAQPLQKQKKYRLYIYEKYPYLEGSWEVGNPYFTFAEILHWLTSKLLKLRISIIR